jgi:predicted outer membrane protein
VQQFATMLHTSHGENLDRTLKLGQQINVRPLLTPAVEAFQVQGARELAAIVPLKGDQFSSAFLQTMIQGHKEALQKIDNDLAPKAESEAVKKHLEETRQQVSTHLELATRLRNSTVPPYNSPSILLEPQQKIKQQ